MASVFTYDPDPPRVESPWSTPGTSTPLAAGGRRGTPTQDQSASMLDTSDPKFLASCGITKLEAEPQFGPTEYKLHLLLRPRRSYLSLSTGNVTCGSSHSKSSTSLFDIPRLSPDPSTKTALSSSGVSRQQRLQQLTTQLLWRLQQSSPFHSTSTSDTVLPLLPEATPMLRVPNRPARLLPGLEESQGALYEIGVSDDGTFVGLTNDEMEESLTNLRAMAASLGCKVEVMRKVAVGYCEWSNEIATGDGTGEVRSEKLWVAEALVIPDHGDYSPKSSPKSGSPRPQRNGSSTALERDILLPTAQLHIAITGPAAAGKSSLLGTLTTSALDNGRGKSRLSLLKHRHEIESGVTSSVAQELIGYSADVSGAASEPYIVNYASGNVTAWNDVHAASEGGRLVFLSDLPGSTRYTKSTLRGLMSWEPQYVVVCVPANSTDEPESADSASELDLAVSYLELCMKLDLAVVIAVTKLDIATRSGLRQTLARILSAIKSTGRKPVMLPAPVDADQEVDLQKITMADMGDAGSAVAAVGADGKFGVPIVITSSVKGAGIGKLHALFRSLPVPLKRSSPPVPVNTTNVAEHEAAKLFDISEVFEVPSFKVYSGAGDVKRQDDRATILCGRARHGNISIGDRLVVGPILVDSSADNGHANLAPRPRSLCSRSLPEELASFYLSSHPESQPRSQAHWQEVRVVSLRNLRLPVRMLLEQQIGTIGVEPLTKFPPVARVRKGMVLADFHPASSSLSIPSPLLAPIFHTGFVATFPATNFSATLSSSLLMGGNAVVYIASVRAAAKVTCIEPMDEPRKGRSTSESDIFSLDNLNDSLSTIHRQNGNTHINNGTNGYVQHGDSSGDIRITFSFVSSVEWIEIGSRVLAMPGSTMAASSSSLRGTGGTLGLRGFVGRVHEVLND